MIDGAGSGLAAGESRKARHAGQAKPTSYAAHPLALELLGAPNGVVDGREHQVLKHLHLTRIDGGWVDLQGTHFARAGDHHADGTSPGRGFEGRLLELVLC